MFGYLGITGSHIYKVKHFKCKLVVEFRAPPGLSLGLCCPTLVAQLAVECFFIASSVNPLEL